VSEETDFILEDVGGVRTRRRHCINPRCGRTFKVKDGEEDFETCCHKCWKLLPPSLVRRYRELRRRDRKIGRLFARQRRLDPTAKPGAMSLRMAIVADQFERATVANWQAIRNYFRPTDRPEGLDSFLEEIGL
jgi:hypothetical protein